MAQVRNKEFVKLRERKEVQENIRVSELQKVRESMNVRDPFVAGQ